jgi:hypothetical protein
MRMTKYTEAYIEMEDRKFEMTSLNRIYFSMGNQKQHPHVCQSPVLNIKLQSIHLRSPPAW